MTKLTVDFSNITGKMKPIHSVNNVPGELEILSFSEKREFPMQEIMMLLLPRHTAVSMLLTY